MISGDNKVRYMRNEFSGSLLLENLTITQFIGKAIASDYLTVRNCIFLKNSNPISCTYYALIDHCLFKENYNTTSRGLITLCCNAHSSVDRYSGSPTTVVNCDFKNNKGIPIECLGTGYTYNGIDIRGCNFINQPGICLRFTDSNPFALSYLGDNYWDGAKEIDVIKKIEGINSFNYIIFNEPLDNGYHDY